MDEKVKRYRLRHKKCWYCKHLIVKNYPLADSCTIWVCKAKDKNILFEEMYRPFCSCFTLNERN